MLHVASCLARRPRVGVPPRAIGPAACHERSMSGASAHDRPAPTAISPARTSQPRDRHARPALRASGTTVAASRGHPPDGHSTPSATRPGALGPPVAHQLLPPVSRRPDGIEYRTTQPGRYLNGTRGECSTWNGQARVDRLTARTGTSPDASRVRPLEGGSWHVPRGTSQCRYVPAGFSMQQRDTLPRRESAVVGGCSTWNITSLTNAGRSGPTTTSHRSSHRPVAAGAMFHVERPAVTCACDNSRLHHPHHRADRRV
jgi:hypothetical protein